MTAHFIFSAQDNSSADAPQSVYAPAHRPCAAEHSEPALPPLDRTDQPADADPERAQEYLRRKLAEGRMSPSRERLMRRELADMERAA